MTEVGLFEAKTHFSELVRKTKEGESFIITQRGEPVAELGPIQRRKDQKSGSIAAAIRRVRAIQKIESISPEEIRSWIEEGRE